MEGDAATGRVRKQKLPYLRKVNSQTIVKERKKKRQPFEGNLEKIENRWKKKYDSLKEQYENLKRKNVIDKRNFVQKERELKRDHRKVVQKCLVLTKQNDRLKTRLKVYKRKTKDLKKVLSEGELNRNQNHINNYPLMNEFQRVLQSVQNNNQRMNRFMYQRSFGQDRLNPHQPNVENYEEMVKFCEKNNVKVGMDKFLINNFPKRVLKEEDVNNFKEGEGRCSICLESYKKEDILLRIPCFHSFHDKCIVKWFDNSKKCPVCSVDIQELIKQANDNFSM